MTDRGVMETQLRKKTEEFACVPHGCHLSFECARRCELQNLKAGKKNYVQRLAVPLQRLVFFFFSFCAG